MTNDERDTVITGLTHLVVSLKGRVDDSALQIAMLREMVKARFAFSDADLDSVVEALRKRIEASAAQQAEAEANAALHQWLVRYKGPSQ